MHNFCLLFFNSYCNFIAVKKNKIQKLALSLKIKNKSKIPIFQYFENKKQKKKIEVFFKV